MQKVDAILKKWELDFNIAKIPLYGHADERQIISPYFGLLNEKTDKIINTCKAGYTVSQNRDVVEMVLKGIEPYGSKLEVSKAGSIGEGRKIFLQLKIDGHAKVGDDTITQYVTIVDSNDGSTGLSVGIGDEASHCFNQFFRFYKGSDAKFRHTATIDAKIASIPELIKRALDENIRQIAIYNKFQSTPLSRNLAHKMVKEVLGYDRVLTSAEDLGKLTKRSEALMDGLYSAIETEYEQVGKNVWGLFNGLTRYTTHQTKINGTKENGKIESMILGRDYDKAMKGYKVLEAAAK